MSEIIEYIKSRTENLSDVSFRELNLEGKRVFITYCDPLIDTNLMSNFVIRSIINSLNENDIEPKYDIVESLKEKINEKLGKNLEKVDLQNTLAINKIKKIDSNSDDIFKYLLSGFALIIYNDEIYAVEARASLTRSITTPSTENSVKGSKDSFVENIMQNIGLIRRRIKSEKLIYKDKEIGRKTKTKVGIMYISDIAKKELVKYVEDKLNRIDIDGILDVNYIQEYIEEQNDSDFPVSINTERPDLVSYYLLQGRICVLVDNSPYVLVLPAFFQDFINNIDDLYQKSKNVTLTKIIRYISLIVTVITPALYLALVTFDQASIPTSLLKSVAQQREGLPFPAFFEAALMVFAFELLKESDMRASKLSSNTLSIVGALILGDAAVSAGIVSPIVIIVVAITTISGMMFSEINIINALRKWRIIFMIFASFCGIVGIGIAFTLFVTSLVSTKSYTKPFTYPVAPFNGTAVKKNLVSRMKISKDKKRQKILTNNLTKSR